ncbi:Conserved_hypothetical protein [Hexamita inflata]|uniref:Uncharacterized protein n=1 Tax=Hexamita inflata TaxID=28002 RepID=A0AA86QIA2_9EUKA|nr:Conserved hypothetical protein [Hexamita inflata]
MFIINTVQTSCRVYELDFRDVQFYYLKHYYLKQTNSPEFALYIYINFTSSRRHKQTSLRLSKAKHGLSHASVSTFKTGSTRHLCPLSDSYIYEEILHSNASSDALQQFAFDFKCQGCLGIFLPGAYYDQMKVDQIQKIDYYIRENGDQITKSKLEQIIGKINTKMTQSKNFFRDTRKEMKIQEKMSLQVDDTVPKPGYTLLGRRRMDNTAFQYMINWVFNNVRDTPIPEICELCKKPYKEGHEQDCKKINELNIAAHDRFANFLERILRKRYQARKVCKDNDNRLEDRTKPDISIVVRFIWILESLGILISITLSKSSIIGTKRIKMVTRSKLFRSQSVRISLFIKNRENTWKNSELISRRFMKRQAT